MSGFKYYKGQPAYAPHRIGLFVRASDPPPPARYRQEFALAGFNVTWFLLTRTNTKKHRGAIHLQIFNKREVGFMANLWFPTTGLGIHFINIKNKRRHLITAYDFSLD